MTSRIRPVTWMPDAFPSLYLDEDVSVILGAILCARGFNALTVRDAKQLGQTDTEQLKKATNGNRVLLTHNRVDFEQLHSEYMKTGKTHAGIVIARRRVPSEMATRIGRLLTRLPSTKFSNQLFYV